jgi:hypothetical protein
MLINFLREGFGGVRIEIQSELKKNTLRGGNGSFLEEGCYEKLC